MNIFDYIKDQESTYKLPVNIFGWDWNMYDHIKTSFFYKHGRLLTGNTDDKPVKNITKPILNLQYRTEDIDVKDIFLYINQPEKYHLSFLIKKYHDEIFVKEHNIDELLDEINITRIDYGLGLLQDIGEAKPRVVDLKDLAFCDQTNILAGPFGLTIYMTPGELKAMEDNGWGDEKNGADITIDELIVLSEPKKIDENGKETNTTGKYARVYEVHGEMPEDWLKDGGDPDKYVNQVQFVAFYDDKDGNKQGVTLFKKKEKEGKFKVIIRDPVRGRACGYGGAEELFEPQVWVNYDVIRMKEMLDAAAKTILKSTDPAVAKRNNLNDLDNLEIIELAEGTDLSQVDTFPRNLAVFEKSVDSWEQHAQQMGAANDSIMGKSPSSGTPFKLQELVTNESRGLHTYRRGIFAKFIEEVYRDGIIPYIIKEITKGKKFLSTLELEEMQFVSEKVITYETNKMIKNKVLVEGVIMDEQQIEAFKDIVRTDFNKDNKKFIEILKDEFKDVPIAMEINIVGKQKNLSEQVDKLVNVFRQVLAAPQILQNPSMAKIFNQILESSGLDPVDFNDFKVEQQTEVPEGQPVKAPEINQ